MSEKIDFLLMCLQTSLQIVFIHILFWPGMILDFMRENRLTPFMQKPLYDCAICMTSVYGFLFWLLEWDMSGNLLAFWFTVGGINVLLSGLIGKAEDVNVERQVSNGHKAPSSQHD
jgi:hypothetical protein